MRNLLFFLSLLLCIHVAQKESLAWVFVTNYGDTGWQTCIYQVGAEGFTGKVGFVVSNVIDDSAYSELLLDNLSHGGGPGNRAFELGNFSGYTLMGGVGAEVTDYVEAHSGIIYTSTEGDYFSHLCGLSTGVSTSAFQNARDQVGTVGAILETSVDLPPGSRFSFDWAFLAGDRNPWNDFALVYLKDSSGKIVFSKGLAQIGQASLIPVINLLLQDDR